MTERLFQVGDLVQVRGTSTQGVLQESKGEIETCEYPLTLPMTKDGKYGAAYTYTGHYFADEANKGPDLVLIKVVDAP